MSDETKNPKPIHRPAFLSIVSDATAIDEGGLQVPSAEDPAQFAAYKKQSSDIPQSPLTRDSKTWTPLPLRPYFWIPLIVFLVGAAIGLEVALHFNKTRQGWDTSQSDTSGRGLGLHYVYTLLPVIVVSTIVTLWAWTDIEIKKMQPYVDLVQGDSPAHRSLLLDYTRDNNFLAWVRALSNQHWAVALASFMVLVTLFFQPLASALLTVKDTWWTAPDMTLTNLAAIGLNQNLQFADLSTFLAGAGFAGASIMYDIPPPPFIKAPYTVAPFELPVTLTNNGTAFANTTAVKSATGCQSVPVSMTQLAVGGWQNSASANGCSFTWSVSNNTTVLFGVNTPTCDNSPPPQFNPVVFWFFSYLPSAAASATFCSPSFSLWDVNVGVDVATGNVTKVTELRLFSTLNTPPSNFSAFSGNVTGAPLNGRAYNGVKFNLTNPDQFVLARQDAIELQLPASIYQASLKTPQGYAGSFDNGGAALTALSDQVYLMYLSLVARDVYFLPDNELINVQVKTFRRRVWFVDAPVHLLAAAFLTLAVIATAVHLTHRYNRRKLHLKHEPGTIASAISIGAQTGVAAVLAGRHAQQDLKEALADKVYRIEPDTFRLQMQGEAGYVPADASNAVARRRSVMSGLFVGRRMSQRVERSAPGTPTSPKSPLGSPRRSASPRAPATPKSPTPPGSPLKTLTNAHASHV